MQEQPNYLRSTPSSASEDSDPESRATPQNLARRPLTPAHLQSVQQCPHCGARVSTTTSICMECGGYLQHKGEQIRCRHCNTLASSNLMICPGCGRELQPAPPRWLSWGAPLIVVAFFLAILTQQWLTGNGPIHWAQAQLSSGWHWLYQLGERLDPQITIETIPVADANVSSRTQLTLDVTPPTDIISVQTPVVGDASLDSVAADVSLNNLPPLTSLAPTEAATPAALPTPTNTATTAPTPTAIDTPTALPSATPTTAATTPAVVIAPALASTAPATIVFDATATVIRTNSKNDAIGAAAAPAEEPTSALLHPTPTFTVLPTATPSPLPSPSPAPVTTYTIRPGDIPATIADRFGVSVNDLLAANQLTLDDARRLRVGQVLIIPTAGASTAAVPPTATQSAPTSAPPSATATLLPAQGDQAQIRVDAPILRSPEDSSYLSCSSTNSLTWLPVAYIRNDDQYLLHLGFLSGYNENNVEQVTWILEQFRTSNVTLWELDESLCGLAPQAFGRQWRWYVEVVEFVDGSWKAVSPPSAIWSFSWN
ncbi:MAG: LysM peptidoglycan-binding domain-containing protein [Caldilineaceae bacterium]